MSPPPSDRPTGRPFVVLLVLLFAAVTAYFALGMPGMDHSTGQEPMDEMEHRETAG